MNKPLVPASIDLTDFAFMPFEFGRLFNSDTWSLSNDAEKVAAITLWGKSWSQKPAGSLPSDDRLLAALSGMGPRWKRVKEMALRGWIACDDGRLYHPVVCVKALEAWLEKLSSRLSSGAGNAKRWGVEFDPSEIEAAILEARAFLAALDPQSRHLTKKRPPGVPSGSKKFPAGNPDAVPPGIPSGSQETGTGTGNKDQEQKHAPHARSPQEPPAGATTSPDAGRACALLKQAGCARVNPAHPDLLAALAEGVSPDALVHTYRENPTATNPFTWAIATARGRHAEGARPITGDSHADRPSGRGLSAVERVRAANDRAEQREQQSALEGHARVHRIEPRGS